jgi:V8-like Glu-specific endopeptidase
MTTMLDELDEILGYESDSEISRPAKRWLVKDTTLEPFRYICQLEVDGEWWGSGTLIGPQTVLTSGHLVVPKSRRSRMRVIPGRNGRNEPLGWATAARLIPMPGYRGKFSPPRTDVGIIQLDKRIGEQIRWWTAGHTARKGDPRGTSILRGPLPMPAGQLSVHVSGYVGDNPKECVRETCGTAQYHSYDATEKRKDGMLYFAGDSHAGHGGPVWIKRDGSNGGHVLVGIQNGAPQERGRNWAVFIDAIVRKFITDNTLP